MYEGVRVCGVWRVLWRSPTELPLPEADEQRFLAWLTAPQDGEPTP